MKHLRFYMIGIESHPQKVMKELGITYLLATPQSIADQWWFWCCENIPKELPDYLSYIGFGLNKNGAKKIRDYKLEHDIENQFKMEVR